MAINASILYLEGFIEQLYNIKLLFRADKFTSSELTRQ